MGCGGFEGRNGTSCFWENQLLGPPLKAPQAVGGSGLQLGEKGQKDGEADIADVHPDVRV